MRRRRGIKVVKELDAFSKVERDHKDVSSRGGLFSVVAIAIIIFLVVFEFFNFKDTSVNYTYSVDTRMDEHLKLRFDITVKMPCHYLGVDVIDAAGESRMLVQEVYKDPTVFELTEKQKEWFGKRNVALHRAKKTRTLSDITVMEMLGPAMPPRDDPPNHAPKSDSCRVHGHIEINKVAGNFHITAGQAVPHIQGHAHINAFVPSDMMNFSHRIDSFTFGESAPGILDPLDGTLIGTTDRNHIFQYYLQIVPTFINTRERALTTHQYSVTERSRHINHTAGSHGLPGVFFKYDIYPLEVRIVEEANSFILFLVRLCALIGGVFVTLGMISQFIGYVQQQISGKQTTTT